MRCHALACERRALLVDLRLGPHHDARNAEPALEPTAGGERIGERLAFDLVDTFEGHDRRALDLVHVALAGHDGLAVDEHGAAPALSRRRASVLRRRDVEFLTQCSQQVRMRAPDGHGRAVHHERHGPVEIIGRGRVGKLGHVLQFVKASAPWETARRERRVTYTMCLTHRVRSGGSGPRARSVRATDASRSSWSSRSASASSSSAGMSVTAPQPIAHRGDRSGAGPSIRGWTVSEMDVFDHADLLEVRERPIHRREIDVVVTFGEFLGGDAATVVVQILEQHPPRLGEPAATLTHPLAPPRRTRASTDRVGGGLVTPESYAGRPIPKLRNVRWIVHAAHDLAHFSDWVGVRTGQGWGVARGA